MALSIDQNLLDVLSTAHVTMTVDDVAIDLTLGNGKTDILDGEVVVLTADTGYEFYTGATGEVLTFFEGSDWDPDAMAYVSFYLNFTIDTEDVTKTSLTFDDRSYESLTVATREGAVATPDYVITATDMQELFGSGSVLEINDVVAEVGSNIFIGDSLVLSAGVGYEFYLQPGVSEETSVYFHYQGGVDEMYAEFYGIFTISEDKKTASFTFADPTDFNGDPVDYKWQEIIVLANQTTEVVGSNKVFVISEDAWDSLNVARFKTEGDGETTVVYDYGKFILNLMELPFSIPEDLILDSENIYLASYDTGVESPVLSVDLIRVDLGSINVPAPHGNLLDFTDVTCVLRLPRVEGVVLDADYVVGERVDVEYLIDCYTGLTTINISSTKTGSNIHTLQADIGIKVPYSSEYNGGTVNNPDISIGGDNGIVRPFIEILQNDPMLPNGFFTGPVLDESVLEGEAGFIKVEEIDLISDATYLEKSKIVGLLQGGVIIR